MKKHLRFPVRLKLVRHPGQTVLNVGIQTKSLVEWCSGLCLLKECLIDTLVISGGAPGERCEIQVGKETKHGVRTRASFEAGTTRMRMTHNDLDYLLHFFLKYYRDGVADVDHLDLEVEAAAEKQDTSITFKVPDAVRPVSAEEAKRRLGLG